MRNIPGEAKGHYKRLTTEILKYGNEGKEELDALFKIMPPKKIFSLPQGPDRGAREAELISEMKVIARDFAEAKSKASRPKKKAETKKMKKAKTSKPKKPPEPQVVKKSGGQIDGFSYVIVELDNGDILAKINRKGRRIVEHDDAPKIYESKRLQKSFADKDAAEFEVRRVVNSAMVWYETRGIRPREKVRRSKEAGRGIGRRTPEMKSAIAKEDRELATIRRKRKEARARKDRMLKEKVIGNPSGKSFGHIPRVNPAKPSFFSHSEDTAEKQAVKAFEAYVNYKDKWDRSIAKGKPRFVWVMKAYDAIENSRANYLLSGNTARAESVNKLKGKLREKIIHMVEDCIAKLSRKNGNARSGPDSVRQEKSNPGSNPSAEVHGNIGRSMLKAADKSLAAWTAGRGSKNLLAAHDGYVSALLELKRGWASPGEGRVNVDEITLAKDGVSRTSWLITEKMKG